jgi:hypothetical protein
LRAGDTSTSSSACADKESQIAAPVHELDQNGVAYDPQFTTLLGFNLFVLPDRIGHPHPPYIVQLREANAEQERRKAEA